MKIIDITLPIHEKMACFPNTPSPKFTQIRKYEDDHKNIWSFEMTTITGTHLEAPLHSVPGGISVDKLDLEKCIGPCLVVDVAGKDGLIQFEEIKHIKAERVLFKTSNSSFVREDKFYDDFTALSAEAAQQLVENGVKLVGIDYYGIEKRGTMDHPVHATLLKAGVIVVVGLDLSEAAPGYYNLIALPNKFVGLDGAPCRAVLVQS
jgi:arylformamidase